MGYFDGLVSGAFKKDDSGNSLFYPWGVFGSGYIVQSKETLEQLRKFLKKYYLVMLITIITIQITVGFWLNLTILPIVIVYYHFYVKKITKDFPKTSEKLTLGQSFSNSAKSHNLPTLIILEVFSVGFVALGILILLFGQNLIIALSSIGFFGLCGVSIGYMIFVKIRK